MNPTLAGEEVEAQRGSANLGKIAQPRIRTQDIWLPSPPFQPLAALCHCVCIILPSVTPRLSPHAADRERRAQTEKERTHGGEGTAGMDPEAEPWVCLSPTRPGLLPQLGRVFWQPRQVHWACEEDVERTDVGVFVSRQATRGYLPRKVSPGSIEPRWGEENLKRGKAGQEKRPR